MKTQGTHGLFEVSIKFGFSYEVCSEDCVHVKTPHGDQPSTQMKGGTEIERSPAKDSLVVQSSAWWSGVHSETV